jgi:hypothetical protein
VTRASSLPRFACWRHRGAREGFEVVFFEVRDLGLHIEGHTTAVEDGKPFAVRYAFELDDRWWLPAGGAPRQR